jgi:hypothetical protein
MDSPGQILSIIHGRREERRFRNATSKAAPRIAHRNGKGCPPNRIHGVRGRSRVRAIYVPIKAPIKPSRMEVKQPKPLRPAKRAPTAPAIAAINNINKNDSMLMDLSL